MPHRRHPLLVTARRSALAAVCLLGLACARSGTVRVVLDSTPVGPGVEVLATTFDPAAFARLARVARDSVARFTGNGLTRTPVVGGEAVLRLPAGSWWLALAERDGRLRLPAVETVVRNGEHRTLQLGVR